MNPGARDKQIVIQRATTTTDDYGGEVSTWADYATEWAAVYYGNGTEQRQAAQEGGSQAASFEVLANPLTRDIKITDRISHEGVAWDITAIAPLGFNEGVRITAVRAA